MARVKNRWIIFRVETAQKSTQHSSVVDRVLKPSVIKAEVDKAAELLFGLLQGKFISNYITVQFTSGTEALVLLQCRRCFLQETLIIAKFINKVQNLEVKFNPLQVCGTLHQARKFILSKILDSLSQISVLELSGLNISNKPGLLAGIEHINLVSNSALPQ